MPGENHNSTEEHKAEALAPAKYFQRLAKLIPQLPFPAIEAIADVILQAYEKNQTVFVFGNGGSAASASHMMVDMNKGTGEPVAGKRLKVMALTDNVPLLTAWANDSSYERVFAEQLKNFVQRGDVAFAISGSGDSANVVLALETARERGAVTVGISGYSGGKMKAYCDICAVVPSNNMQMIEDMHHSILHSIFIAVRENMASRKPRTMAAVTGRLQK